VVVVVNDMAWERENELVALTVNATTTGGIKITRASDSSRDITFQFVSDPIRDTVTLYFDPGVLAPLSITTFFIEKVSEGTDSSSGNFPVYEDYSLSNGLAGLEFSNGRVSKCLLFFIFCWLVLRKVSHHTHTHTHTHTSTSQTRHKQKQHVLGVRMVGWPIKQNSLNTGLLALQRAIAEHYQYFHRFERL